MKEGIFNTAQRKLSNGIELITIKKSTQITAIHVGINIGSLYEQKEEKGIAHFIEHLLFKGTTTRNNEVLNTALENLGGEYNAYTDYTCTVFSITALSNEVENGLELLGDMLIHSHFPEAEIEKERGVILAEIRTSKDDVEELSFKRIHEFAFEKSPLRFDPIGEERTVKRISREQLLGFYHRYYVPNNCFISIVSPFEHEEVQKMVEKYFGQWEEKEVTKTPIYPEKNIATIRQTYKKELEQSTITYLYTFHGLSKKEELALRILNHKFGESANSILFRELREEKGLAYDIYTHLDSTNEVKTLYIYTAVAEEYVDEAIQTINQSIDKMKREEIIFDEGTITLMKKIFKTAVASTLEDSTDLGNYVIHQAMEQEEIYQFMQDMKDMEQITREDLYEAARKVFQNPTMHILLPEKDEA